MDRAQKDKVKRKSKDTYSMTLSTQSFKNANNTVPSCGLCVVGSPPHSTLSVHSPVLQGVGNLWTPCHRLWLGVASAKRWQEIRKRKKGRSHFPLCSGCTFSNGSSSKSRRWLERSISVVIGGYFSSHGANVLATQQEGSSSDLIFLFPSTSCQ